MHSAEQRAGRTLRTSAGRQFAPDRVRAPAAVRSLRGMTFHAGTHKHSEQHGPDEGSTPAPCIEHCTASQPGVLQHDLGLPRQSSIKQSAQTAGAGGGGGGARGGARSGARNALVCAIRPRRRISPGGSPKRSAQHVLLLAAQHAPPQRRQRYVAEVLDGARRTQRAIKRPEQPQELPQAILLGGGPCVQDRKIKNRVGPLLRRRDARPRRHTELVRRCRRHNASRGRSCSHSLSLAFRMGDRPSASLYPCSLTQPHSAAGSIFQGATDTATSEKHDALRDGAADGWQCGGTAPHSHVSSATVSAAQALQRVHHVRARTAPQRCGVRVTAEGTDRAAARPAVGSYATPPSRIIANGRVANRGHPQTTHLRQASATPAPGAVPPPPVPP